MGRLLMPLDKSGNEYTPLTERDLARMRATPFPENFARNSNDLRAYQAAHAADAPREYRAPEVRVAPEPMAKAIKRNIKRKG